MPGRIQKKFIQISSIILCAVIVLLLVGLNVWHQAYVDSKQEQILDLIATYGGAPEMSRHVEGSERAARLEETTGLTPYQALLTSLYFTADTNPTGVTAVDLTGSEDLRTAEAMEIAEAARMEGTLSGQIAQFRYVRTRDAVGDAHYVFLNVSQYMIQSVQLGSASFGLGCLAIAAVMGYVWYGALKWIRPLERRTEDSARLMENVSEALRQDEKGDIERAAEELSAGAAVLDGASSQLEVVSLSETLTRVCREVGPSIEKRGGQLITDIQPDVYVRTHEGEAQTLCRLLLWEAVRTMRDDGTIHADLLSDGREVGLIVRSTDRPWAEDGEPEGNGLGAVQLIARDNDGTAAFEAIPPDTQCYSVRFRTAHDPRGGQ